LQGFYYVERISQLDFQRHCVNSTIDVVDEENDIPADSKEKPITTQPSPTGTFIASPEANEAFRGSAIDMENITKNLFSHDEEQGEEVTLESSDFSRNEAVAEMILEELSSRVKNAGTKFAAFDGFDQKIHKILSVGLSKLESEMTTEVIFPIQKI